MAKLLTVTISDGSKKAGSLKYKNRVNFDDFKQLAIILFDLETQGAKIEKAYKEFKKKKREGWPFS